MEFHSISLPLGLVMVRKDDWKKFIDLIRGLKEYCANNTSWHLKFTKDFSIGSDDFLTLKRLVVNGDVPTEEYSRERLRDTIELMGGSPKLLGMLESVDDSQDEENKDDSDDSQDDSDEPKSGFKRRLAKDDSSQDDKRQRGKRRWIL